MSSFICGLLLLLAGLTHSPLLQAAKSSSSARVHYVGGTGASLAAKSDVVIELGGDDNLLVECKGASISVPYGNVNTLEYGQRVDRRVIEAVLISPLMLLSKKRTHFLTIGFTDTDGHQQAMVFRVSPGDIRTLLVALEARTGRKVEYQDDEARKAGKG